MQTKISVWYKRYDDNKFYMKWLHHVGHETSPYTTKNTDINKILKRMVNKMRNRIISNRFQINGMSMAQRCFFHFEFFCQTIKLCWKLIMKLAKYDDSQK